MSKCIELYLLIVSCLADVGYQLGDDVGVNYVVMQIHYAHAIAGKLACYGMFYLIGFPA